MKRKRSTQEQIAYEPREAERGSLRTVPRWMDTEQYELVRLKIWLLRRRSLKMIMGMEKGIPACLAQKAEVYRRRLSQ